MTDGDAEKTQSDEIQIQVQTSLKIQVRILDRKVSIGYPLLLQSYL
jgi:hypothetical protein